MTGNILDLKGYYLYHSVYFHVTAMFTELGSHHSAECLNKILVLKEVQSNFWLGILKFYDSGRGSAVPGSLAPSPSWSIVQ